MITLALDAASVAKIRLAPSPAHEVMSWLLLTLDGQPHPTYGDPGPVAKGALKRREMRVLIDILEVATRSHFTPNFLTPKANGPTPTLDDQMGQIENASGVDVAEQVLQLDFGRTGPSATIKRALERGNIGAQAAHGLGLFWREALRDDWPNLQRLLRNECNQRAESWSTTGLGNMLNSLHRRIAWTNNEIQIEGSHFNQRFTISDAELVLSPGVLGSRYVMVQDCHPDDLSIFYPIAVGRSSRPRRTASPELIGLSRAALLKLLDVPRSTQELAALAQLSPATTSYHLHILQRAEMVTSERVGRHVKYQSHTFPAP